MKWLIMVIGCASFLIACGSPATPGSNSVVGKTNVNNVNRTSYPQNENAYTFAQISKFADELTPSGKEASEIVGKTVTESKLWENKTFDRELKKLMGPDYVTMKNFWNTETAIKKFGDFLMMTGCEKNNCVDNQYVIFVDLGDGRINVIHIGKDVTREWNLYGEIDNLPPLFAEELTRMKSHN